MIAAGPLLAGADGLVRTQLPEISVDLAFVRPASVAFRSARCPVG